MTENLTPGWATLETGDHPATPAWPCLFRDRDYSCGARPLFDHATARRIAEWLQEPPLVEDGDASPLLTYDPRNDQWVAIPPAYSDADDRTIQRYDAVAGPDGTKLYPIGEDWAWQRAWDNPNRELIDRIHSLCTWLREHDRRELWRDYDPMLNAIMGWIYERKAEALRMERENQ